MADTATVLDAYLISRFGISLECALNDAAAGVASFALRDAVAIACVPVGRHVYDDDGASEAFAGTVACEGVIYRFTCSVFSDPSGMRHVETIDKLEAVGWAARLAVPSHGF